MKVDTSPTSKPSKPSYVGKDLQSKHNLEHNSTRTTRIQQMKKQLKLWTNPLIQKTHLIVFWFWGASLALVIHIWILKVFPSYCSTSPVCTKQPSVNLPKGGDGPARSCGVSTWCVAYLDDPSDLFVPDSLGTKHGHKPLLGFVSPITKSNWSSKSDNESMELHQGLSLRVAILQIILHRYLPSLVVWIKAGVSKFPGAKATVAYSLAIILTFI